MIEAYTGNHTGHRASRKRPKVITAPYLSPMMQTLYNDAARQDVEAILDLAKRSLRNGMSVSYGVFMEYPAGFDFRAMMDGLVKTTELGGSEEVRKPFCPGNPFGAWALRDAEAAFRYVVEGTSRGQSLRWSDMPHELGKKWGSLEADRWMGAKLAALSPDEQRALLAESDLTGSQGTLRKYITQMPTEVAAAEFRFQYLDSTKNGMLGSSLEVLNDVPDVEERVAIIERLRGVKNDFGLRASLENWGISADRIDRIIKTVTQPAAP